MMITGIAHDDIFQGYDMKINRYFIALFLCISMQASGNELTNKGEYTVDFDQKKFTHRWSNNDQYEFTPGDQSVSGQWEDMITINYYKDVHEGEGLAEVANKVLDNYKKYGGKIILTDSVPETQNRLAEHIVAVVLGDTNFLEFVLARFSVNEGTGASVVYSHRIYGSDASSEMSEWMQVNGPKLQAELMQLEEIPSYEQLSQVKNE